MLPPEEYLIVDRTIRKNIDGFDGTMFEIQAGGTVFLFTDTCYYALTRSVIL